MPPPPPPSKSYLINITDSDLSSDDDQDYSRRYGQSQTDYFRSLAKDASSSNFSDNNDALRIRNEDGSRKNSLSHLLSEDPGQSKQSVLRKDTPETFSCTEDGDDEEDNGYYPESRSSKTLMSIENEMGHTDDISLNDGDDDDDEDDDIANSSATGGKKNRKRKKNKKRKKKKRNNNNDQAASTSTEDPIVSSATSTKTRRGNDRRIHFGSVSVHFHERVLGTDVVPLDGGWPLGIGNAIGGNMGNSEDAVSCSTTISVDEYEAAKQERLLGRWKLVQMYSESQTGNAEPSRALESRQWDYKQGSKNPLFSLLIEKQRMALLLGEQTMEELLEEKYKNEHKKREAKKQQSSSSPSSKNKKNHTSSKQDSVPVAGGRKSRSGSHCHGSQERYNDDFTEFDVHHIRNELENLRNLRTQEESRGCTCRKLDVYIPPPNAGKKAAHRRLNIHKITEELRKRHALPTKNCTRDELELLLHDIVASEPCCRDDNCPCAKNGIECQSDACNCWLASHQQKSCSHSSPRANSNNTSNNKKTQQPTTPPIMDEITPDVIQTRCGNKNGMYTVDPQHISDYRQPFLTCRPVADQN